MKYYRITDFGLIGVNLKTSKTLRRLHLGDIKQSELVDINNTPYEVLLEVKVGAAKPNTLFSRQETGYFLQEEKLFYRDYNKISYVNGGEVYYKGKIPGSYLSIKVQKNTSSVKAEINATPTFVWESRSRLTRNQNFEELVSNLFISLSILQNKIPLHAAAIEVDEKAIVFFGYSNTGKTTTSLAVSKKMKGKYVAEDICFFDASDFSIFSCPHTSMAGVMSEKIHSLPCKMMLGLRPSLKKEGEVIQEVKKKDFLEFLLQMNAYEFSWDHNHIIAQLFSGSNEMSLGSLINKYNEDLAKIVQHASCFFIGGSQRDLWVELTRSLIAEN